MEIKKSDDKKVKPTVIGAAAFAGIAATTIGYILAVLLPYKKKKEVSDEEIISLKRAAFTAKEKERTLPDEKKEYVIPLPASRESFFRRLSLIDSAQKTIDMLMFDTYDDEGSKLFYTSLIMAADRGVRVRIVVDGKLGRLRGRLTKLERLLQKHNNIAFFTFNDANIADPAGLMTLMHDKIVIVDGQKLVIGGANMGMHSYAENHDYESIICGGESATPQAAEMYFEDILSSGKTKRKKAKKCDFSYLERLKKEYSAVFEEIGYNKGVEKERDGIPVDKITLLKNDISSGKKTPRIYDAVLELMRTSRETIAVTPYLFYGKKKTKELIEAASENDSFTIITNSLYNTQNVAFADYEWSKKKYLRGNIQLLELQTEEQLHAKLYVFDERYSVVGSFNLDERSAHIDTECVVVIDSPAFAKSLKAYIQEELIANSVRVEKDGKYPSGVTVKKPSVGKRFLYRAMRALSPFIDVL